MTVAEDTNTAAVRLATALATYGINPSILEPEDRRRSTGRVRLVLTSDAATKLTNVLLVGR
jgi:hypothetical protein